MPQAPGFDPRDIIAAETVSDKPLDKEVKDQLYQGRIATIRNSEEYEMAFWNWGVRFWNEFPDDKRRFEWLLKYIWFPKYFINLDSGVADEAKGLFTSAMNVESFKLWKRQYDAFRNEFMASPQTTEQQRERLKFTDLIRDLDFQKYGAIRKLTNWNPDDWARRAIDYARYWYHSTTPNMDIDIRIGLTDSRDQIQYALVQPAAEDFGISVSDRERILKLFIRSGLPKVQEQAQENLTLLTIGKRPFGFHAISIDSQLIDMKKFNGKVVLFDFWDVSCTGCIHFMPSINEIYKKYKDAGFEVVSVCTEAIPANKELAKQKAIEIYQRIGATWPLIFLDPYEQLFDKYGFISLSNLLLFDRSGHLVAHNGQLLQAKPLEAIVKSLL
jgi:thiol-disulfide isomerase/thioredoxin